MPLEGKHLGRYLLQRLIGSGGMGEVYLAQDTRVPRQLAIKVIRTEVAPLTDPTSAQEARRLFQREMKLISSLDHPHILPLYDFGEEQLLDTSLTYMVMPLREEGSLATWLSKRGRGNEPLAPGDVAEIIRQAGSALQYAHDQKIIHQDVKPPNFLIRTSAEHPGYPYLQLADFGIARMQNTTSTSSHAIRGTPLYMAPEQWEGRPVYASDQYALAIMAYQMLAGRAPFSGRMEQIMRQHFMVQPPPPSTYNPVLSSAVDAVLLKALAKQPDERYSSLFAFATTLHHALLGSTQQSQAQPAPVLPQQSAAAQPQTPLAPSSPTQLPATPAASSFQRPSPTPEVSAPTPALPPTPAHPAPTSATPSSPALPGMTPVRHSTPSSTQYPGAPPTPPPYQSGIATSSSGLSSTAPADAWQRYQQGAPTITVVPGPLPGSITRRPVSSRSRHRMSKVSIFFFVFLALLVIVGGSSAFVILNQANTATGKTRAKTGVTPINALPAAAPADRQLLSYPLLTSNNDANTLDPAQSIDSLSMIPYLISSGLVMQDDQMHVVPGLASSWQMSSDGTAWTFHLRPNLKFSDGQPLSARDVVYSIDRALQPSTKAAATYILSSIVDADKLAQGKISTLIGDSLLTPDPFTVTIKTSTQAGYFPSVLLDTVSFVVEKQLIDKYGLQFTAHLNEGGCAGPFMVSSFIPGTEINLVPNPNYYGQKPRVQKLKLPLFNDAETAYKAFQADQVDIATLPRTEIPSVQHTRDFHQRPDTIIRFVGMNYLTKPLDNVHIRQALALAIDKTLLQRVLPDDTATNHIIPPQLDGANQALTGPQGVTALQGDQAKARQLLQQGLQEAGYGSINALPAITLTYSGTTYSSLANVLVQQWQSVLHIPAHTQDIPSFADYVTKIFAAHNNSNGLQCWLEAWSNDYPDAQAWTTALFRRDSDNNAVNFGVQGPADQQQLEDRMAAADRLLDGTTRTQAYASIEQGLVNDVAWLPLLQENRSYLLKPDIFGLHLNASGIIPPDDWSKIFVTAQ